MATYQRNRRWQYTNYTKRFPEHVDYMLAAVSEGDVIPEAELRALLRAVDLEYLVEREGGLDAVVDWGTQLSLGEQQRLGMARLFYHRPKFAILDECTSGVTVRSYSCLTLMCVVFIASCCSHQGETRPLVPPVYSPLTTTGAAPPCLTW